MCTATLSISVDRKPFDKESLQPSVSSNVAYPSRTLVEIDLPSRACTSQPRRRTIQDIRGIPFHSRLCRAIDVSHCHILAGTHVPVMSRPSPDTWRCQPDLRRRSKDGSVRYLLAPSRSGDLRKSVKHLFLRAMGRAP